MVRDFGLWCAADMAVATAAVLVLLPPRRGTRVGPCDGKGAVPGQAGLFARTVKPMTAGAPEAGLWLHPPGSITWRIGREAVLLLGGGRALLLQLAHPAVAAGVAEHSDFRSRPLRRLLRTLKLTLSLSFGTRAQALAAARTINRTHQRVRGPGYEATEPRLLLWVHTTLVESTFATHAAFIRPLSVEERAAYYRESQVVGSLLGIPPGAYPTGLAAFERYVERMVSLGPGSELVVDDRARALAAAVLRPPGLLPQLAALPTTAVTAGLLPPPLREVYALRWGRRERAVMGALRGVVPRALPLLPERLRYLRAPG
jgi:uncharacterized protein (DUF2236 family)